MVSFESRWVHSHSIWSDLLRFEMLEFGGVEGGTSVNERCYVEQLKIIILCNNRRTLAISRKYCSGENPQWSWFVSPRDTIKASSSTIFRGFCWKKQFEWYFEPCWKLQPYVRPEFAHSDESLARRKSCATEDRNEALLPDERNGADIFMGRIVDGSPKQSIDRRLVIGLFILPHLASPPAAAAV